MRLGVLIAPLDAEVLERAHLLKIACLVELVVRLRHACTTILQADFVHHHGHALQRPLPPEPLQHLKLGLQSLNGSTDSAGTQGGSARMLTLLQNLSLLRAFRAQYVVHGLVVRHRF